jgi:hypothetical protein
MCEDSRVLALALNLPLRHDNVSPLVYVPCMEPKRHQGDFTCVEEGALRTFYMTCLCGWSCPIQMVSAEFNSYYLQNMWLSHMGKAKRVD